MPTATAGLQFDGNKRYQKEKKECSSAPKQRNTAESRVDEKKGSARKSDKWSDETGARGRETVWASGRRLQGWSCWTGEGAGPPSRLSFGAAVEQL